MYIIIFSILFLIRENQRKEQLAQKPWYNQVLVQNKGALMSRAPFIFMNFLQSLSMTSLEKMQAL